MALNKNTLAAVLCTLAALNFTRLAQAQTQFELTAGLGYHQLEIFRKAAPADHDNTATAKLALGAYRQVSQHAWGAVAEHITPINRTNTTGSGKITGFRPVNYRYYWSDSIATELFLGAAQYDWIKMPPVITGERAPAMLLEHSPLLWNIKPTKA